MIVRIAYTVFVGILLATSVGVGIAAFWVTSNSLKPDLSNKLSPIFGIAS